MLGREHQHADEIKRLQVLEDGGQEGSRASSGGGAGAEKGALLRVEEAMSPLRPRDPL